MPVICSTWWVMEGKGRESEREGGGGCSAPLLGGAPIVNTVHKDAREYLFDVKALRPQQLM